MNRDNKIRPKMKDYDRETYTKDKHLFDLIEWSWWAEERIKELESLSKESKEEENREDWLSHMANQKHPLTCDRHSRYCETKTQTGGEGILIQRGENMICPCGDYTQYRPLLTPPKQ